jgi:hypothetical protein
MKKAIILFAALLVSTFAASAQTYKFVTTIESVIPAGIGRSRMIISEEDNKMTEVELENFFSFVGINFGNIKKNDEIITKTLADMEKKGYQMLNVTSGVYSSVEGQGLFITRYIFRKD